MNYRFGKYSNIIVQTIGTGAGARPTRRPPHLCRQMLPLHTNLWATCYLPLGII